MRATCAAGRPPRRGDRRPGLVSRPRRVRSPVSSTWRPTNSATRCSTSSERSTRFAQVAGSQRRLREATRRALPRSRRRALARRRASWPRSSSTTRRWRSSACRARRCSRRPIAAGLEAVPEAFADRAYRPDGGLVSRREHGSVLTDPSADRRTRACGWRSTARCSRSTDRSCTSRPARCACTATPRVPSRSPGRCATRSTRPASASAASPV